jgi:hypothetical protein
MQNLDSNVITNNILTLGIAIAVICVTISLINGYIQYSNNVQGQIDSTRVHEGLPTEIEITPEDLINNPELAEILEFEALAEGQTLNISLESNEHFEQQQNQSPAVDYTDLDTIYDIIENFISSIF